MEQEIDEVNKIIHLKCTQKEREKVIRELSAYLYDYQFHFILIDDPSETQAMQP